VTGGVIEEGRGGAGTIMGESVKSTRLGDSTNPWLISASNGIPLG